MPEQPQTPTPVVARRSKLARAVHAESYTLSRRKAFMEQIEARQNLSAPRPRIERSPHSQAG